MLNLFEKKEKLIDGVLFLKKDDVDAVVDDLVFINLMVGNDLYETEMLAQKIHDSGCMSAIQVPVRTTEKIWNYLKTTNKLKKLLATSEKVVAC